MLDLFSQCYFGLLHVVILIFQFGCNSYVQLFVPCRVALRTICEFLLSELDSVRFRVERIPYDLLGKSPMPHAWTGRLVQVN